MNGNRIFIYNTGLSRYGLRCSEGDIRRSPYFRYCDYCNERRKVRSELDTRKTASQQLSKEFSGRKINEAVRLPPISNKAGGRFVHRPGNNVKEVDSVKQLGTLTVEELRRTLKSGSRRMIEAHPDYMKRQLLAQVHLKRNSRRGMVRVLDRPTYWPSDLMKTERETRDERDIFDGVPYSYILNNPCAKKRVRPSQILSKGRQQTKDGEDERNNSVISSIAF